MDELDPVPRVNPVFKGLVTAVLIVAIAVSLYGMAALSVFLLTRGLG